MLREWTFLDIGNGQLTPGNIIKEYHFQTAYKHMCDAQEAGTKLQKALDRQGSVGKISRSTLHQLKVSRISTLCSMAKIHVSSDDRQHIYHRLLAVHFDEFWILRGLRLWQ